MGFEEQVLELLKQINNQTSEIRELKNTILDYIHENHRLTTDLGIANQKVIALTKELSKALTANKKASKKNDSLHKKVDTLSKEVEKKTIQLHKNSLNSSQPSSSNPFKKVFNNRKKSDAFVGGQYGHLGHTLDTREPDSIRNHYPTSCPRCGTSLFLGKEYVAKQIVEVEILTKVTEHRYYSSVCSTCGKEVQAEGEYTKKGPIQYGSTIKEIVALLRDYGYISTSRLQEIVSSLTNGKIKIAQSSIVNISNTLGKEIRKLLPSIKQKLVENPIMHCDETSVRVKGKLYWVHNYSNGKLTFYQLHKSRGEEALKEAEILEKYEGILISDPFAMYFKYGTQRGECNVHILRYLYAIEENQQRKWAIRMREFLLDIKKEKTEVLMKEGNGFREERWEEISEEYDNILLEAKKEYEEDRSKIKAPSDEDVKLYRRMKAYKKEHLLYVYDFRVPFSNNLAERDVRMFKTKIKVSGGFRSAKSAENYMNISSLISTLKKNGINVSETIIEIFERGIEKAAGVHQLLLK